MGELAKKVFLRVTAVLAILCFGCLFLVGAGSAEFYILVISGIINCGCVIISLSVLYRMAKKKDGKSEK